MSVKVCMLVEGVCTLCVFVVVVFELLGPPDHEASLQTALVLVLVPSHHMSPSSAQHRQ